MGSKDKATMHKNKRLSDYLYSIAIAITLYIVCLMSIKTEHFIKL